MTANFFATRKNISEESAKLIVLVRILILSALIIGTLSILF
ncbi:MAG: hypothetical protein WD355_08505 [Balneolaceae bacterium]